jgi:7-cyano-7-deazaguanine synthase in queuosine biosynthesis
MIYVGAKNVSGTSTYKFLERALSDRKDQEVILFQIREKGLDTRFDPIARDFVRIAAAVNLADRQVRRSTRSGHRPRSFNVTVTVSDVALWRRVSQLVEAMASFASQDLWRLEFAQSERTAGILAEPAPAADVVALFSGGLDSLCGAAHLTGRDEDVLLLTHSPPSRERVDTMVRQLPKLLRGGTPSRFHLGSISVVPEQRDTAGRRSRFQEFTRRTRPFLYLSIAAAAAIVSGARRVQMSENGALGSSLPFRRSHYGPRITRQGHSFMLEGFEKIVAALRPDHPPVRFVNPFSASTKGEACKLLLASPMVAKATLSCEYSGQQIARLKAWSQLNGLSAHRIARVRQCGLCVPCIVRRAALKRAGLPDPAGDYYFHADRTLKRIQSGRASPDLAVQPPLFAFVSVHPVYAARFASEILSTDLASFASQYMNELASIRPAVISKRRMEEVFNLQRRFARELLDYLDG